MNHNPLGAAFLGIVCDELRRKLEFSQRPVSGQVHDTGHFRAAEADAHGSGHSHDQLVRHCGKGLRFVCRTLAQTAATQSRDDFRECLPISNRNRFRRCVEIVRVVEWTCGKLFVDPSGQSDVGNREHNDRDERENSDADKCPSRDFLGLDLFLRFRLLRTGLRRLLRCRLIFG